MDLGEFYRSCLTSKGPRYGCIGNCPRSYLDPQGMLDDVGLFNTLSAQMQGEVMLLHPILVTRVLKDLKTCPCNNLRNWLLLHLCATSLRQTAACFKIVHDPQHSAQLYSAAVTLSKYMHKKSSIEDKLRGLHETTGRITDICNDMEKWIEWEACRCQHKLCPINAIAEQNMQKASLEVLHALQESRPQLNSALKMAANDTQKQKLLLDWTNVIWAHTHALMVSIIKSNLEPITTRLADDLIVQEAAQKSSKGKKQARNKPATLAPSAHQHADNCESVDALFICPLTKVRRRHSCSCSPCTTEGFIGALLCAGPLAGPSHCSRWTHL